MSVKRQRILTCTDAAHPTARHELMTHVSDILTLAHPSTQLTQMVSMLLEQCPTVGLETFRQWSESKYLSSAAIRDSLWSRHLPWEMLDHIFLFLEITELMRAEWVCKRWRVASMQRGFGWSRNITLIKSPILERQLKAPRQPVCARVLESGPLQDTRMTASFLVNFPSLTHLHLPQDSGWDDSSMVHLAHLPNLNVFQWTGGRLTAASMNHVLRLTKLTTLTLIIDNEWDALPVAFNLTQSVGTQIARLPLTELELCGFTFSDAGLSQIFSSCALDRLILRGSQLEVKSTAFSILSKSTTLTELTLDHILPDTLSAPLLTSLALNHMRIKRDEKIDFAQRFPKLTFFALSYSTVLAPFGELVKSLAKVQLQRLAIKRINFDTSSPITAETCVRFTHLEECDVEESSNSTAGAFAITDLALQSPQLKAVCFTINETFPNVLLLRRPRKLQVLFIGTLSSKQVKELSEMPNLSTTVDTLGIKCNESLTWDHLRHFQKWEKLTSVSIQAQGHEFLSIHRGDVREHMKQHFGRM